MTFNAYINRKNKPFKGSLDKELREFMANGGKIKKMPTKYLIESNLDHNFFITKKQDTIKE